MKPPAVKDQVLKLIHQPRRDISKILIPVIAGFGIFNARCSTSGIGWYFAAILSIKVCNSGSIWLDSFFFVVMLGLRIGNKWA